jgi:hypothetical protein
MNTPGSIGQLIIAVDCSPFKSSRAGRYFTVRDHPFRHPAGRASGECIGDEALVRSTA